MVPLGGLEPPAQGLGNLCSIHLSYRGTKLIGVRDYSQAHKGGASGADEEDEIRNSAEARLQG